MKAQMRELKPNEMRQSYTRSDVKNWISFGIKNGYVNQFKKDEVSKWADLILKHGVVNMSGNLLLGEDNAK